MFQLSLEQKVALITGGNGGLGKALALGLQNAGAGIAVTGRDPTKNAAVQSELGPDCLDILINCAGSFHGGPLTELSLGWRDVLDSHLTGSFLVSKHAARVMIAAGRGGKIINVGSMYSLFGAPDFADYAAAKTGILGLTRSLAVELGKHNIQVNAILPGWYETDLTSGMPAAPLGEEIRRRTPLARWGVPSDLVGLVILLSSEASDFITGVSIPVDGGYCVTDRLLY